MDALSLSGHEVATRLACIERLRAVADDMAHVSQRLIAELGDGEPLPTKAIAFGPLAMAARQGWGCAQAVLLQADAGIVSPRMIDTIAARDQAVESQPLRQLALSTLRAAERRLRATSPADCQREAL